MLFSSRCPKIARSLEVLEVNYMYIDNNTSLNKCAFPQRKNQMGNIAFSLIAFYDSYSFTFLLFQSHKIAGGYKIHNSTHFIRPPCVFHGFLWMDIHYELYSMGLGHNLVNVMCRLYMLLLCDFSPPWYKSTFSGWNYFRLIGLLTRLPRE